MALRRDVIRFRRSRKRPRSWNRSRAGWPCGRAAYILAPALLAAVCLAFWLNRPSRPVEPLPTAAPGTTAAPAPGRPDGAPDGVVIEATAAPTQPVLGGEDLPGGPVTRVDSREALIRLFWQMIDSGQETARLEALTLSDAEVAETIDKFSNYFDAYAVDADGPGLTVAFKTGVKVLSAIRQGREEALDEGEKAIARRAREIVDSLVFPGMTDAEKELAIHDYIVDHCAYLTYVRGYDTNSARGFFENGLCQCAGYVDTFRLLARLAGLEVEMIGGPTTRDLPSSKGHAWNLIRLDGLWYVVDVTWDDMVGTGNTLEHTFFNLPCTVFGGSRSWDDACCPAGTYAATVDDKYYYSRPGFAARTTAEAVELAQRQIAADGKAYIYFPGGGDASAVGAALGCRAEELSQDLTIDLYTFTPR